MKYYFQISILFILIMKNEVFKDNKDSILIINMDINRSIIFKDNAKGSSLESSIKLSITQEVWGKIDKETNKWILYYDIISIYRPDNNPDLITYFDYLKKTIRTKTPEEIPDNDERSKINLNIKKEWEKICEKFFDKGQPGESLYPKYLEIYNKQKIPQSQLANIEKDEKFKNFYENNFRFIFPSLFQMMIDLKNQGRKFILIFRTFGKDFSDLSFEFNSFCEGKHPLYKDIYFDGTHNSFDHRIIKETTGSFHRLINDDVNNIFLVIGDYDHPELNTKEELYNYYNKNKIIQGGNNIFKYINDFSSGKKTNSFFISDDFFAWFKHDRKKEYGKPIFFDPKNKNYHFIFFDDNIGKKPTSIVDCKNIINGKTLENEDVIGKYLIKVDTIEAAINNNYFIDKIKECEQKLNY